jgi:hypothetical protein
MSNCGCSPSGYPSANNECCDDVANLARFAYANAQQAAASAANAATTLADAVQKSGDTMTGPLILSGDPVAPLGASTKQYVDNAVSIGLTIPDGSITTPKLANLAVDTGKIADGSVTTIKLATNAVDNNKIQDLTITTNKIADNQITDAKLDSTTRIRIAKAWVNFDGTLSSPIAPLAAYNVSSVTKNATGSYTINFTATLADANYSISGMCNSYFGSSVGLDPGGSATTVTTKTASAVRVITRNYGTSGTDMSNISIQIFGN